MPWNKAARDKYKRNTDRYESDLADDEWSLLEPFMPPPARTGRPRTSDLREIMNAILYCASSGCQWRMLPKDFPPFTTVQNYFYKWRDDGTLERMTDALREWERRRLGRDPEPSAGVIDSQSVKTTESGGPRGYDAGKKVKGRKRHVIVDTEGLPVTMRVHPADVQDRDGAVELLTALQDAHPSVELVWADSGYSGPKLRSALGERGLRIRVEVVKKIAGSGFEVLPRRWVVERTFAWLNRCRRLAKDVERSVASALAWLRVAAVRLLSRRLAREARQEPEQCLESIEN